MNNTVSIDERVVATLAKENLTPDEIADKIGESLLAVRPVCTILRKEHGILVRTGEQRINKVSGKKAHVLALKNPAVPYIPLPSLAPSVPAISPVHTKMVEQAKKLGYSADDARILFKSEMPADTLDTLIKQVFI